MKRPYYQQGNTIRITATFKDWNGTAVDPSNVKFIVYDANFIKKDEWTIGPSNRIDTGTYSYDYIPAQIGTFFIEWYCEIDGLPSLKREKLEVRRYMR